MPVRIIQFPKGGGNQEQHVIHQRLDELGKDIKWLAGEMRVKPRAIQNHIAGKSELKGRTFALMLGRLGIDLNYYCRVGKYARSNGGQPVGHTNNSNSPKLSH